MVSINKLKLIVSKPNVQALAVSLLTLFVILLPLWWMICSRYEDRLVSEQKAQDNIELQLIKYTLSHAMARRTALFEGLCAYVESNPAKGNLKSEINHLMSGLFAHAQGIRVMALAPGGIQRYVYPLKGNESVVGHDILNDKRPHVQKAIQHALQSRKIIFNGPYELRQGGLALVMRKAIFIEDDFWGLAAMVIDIPPIIQESGLLLKSNDIQLALRDQQGHVFFGKDTLFETAPLILRIKMHDGYWELGGIPFGGWQSFVGGKLSHFQIITFLIVILITAVLYLLSFRHRYLLYRVREKTDELSESLENLRQSEERLTKFLDSATDGFILLDSELSHVEMNNVALELTGLEREDVISKPLIDTVPGIRESGRYDQYKNVIKTGKPYHIEDLTPHPLTGRKHIELNAFKVGDGLGIIFTDITDRKLAEKSLTESHKAIKNQNIIFAAINRLFHESIACSTSAEVAQLCLSIAEEVTGSQYGSVAEVNRNNRFDTLALSNPGWEQCRMAELNPKLIHDMPIRGIWGAALNNEKGLIINDPSNHPLSVGIPEGHPPLTSFLGIPFHHKNFNGMIGIANKEGGYTETDRDIVEALALSFAEVINGKRSEEALRDSETKYRLSMEATTDGIWDWDIPSDEVYYSPSWGRILGEIDVISNYSAWTSRIHPDDNEEVSFSLQHHLKGESEFWYKEHRLKTKSGDWKWVLGRGRVVQKDNNGKPLRMIGTMTDISKLKEVQTQLHQAQKLESIGILAGGIAHDFNNILSAIIGFTELTLDNVQPGSDIEDNLQEVYSAGKRAKNLVKQILTFARQTDVKIKPMQVDRILKEVLHFTRSSIPTSIEIKQNINSKSLIMGNATQVHQVVMNLCTNAAHAMLDGGVLSIGLNDVIVDKTDQWKGKDLKPGRYVQITVSDTGTGISPEIIDSIFEPYFTTKGVGEGTGMGLSVVHGIVEGYYGKIVVDSTLGKGAVFTVYLPTTKRRRSKSDDRSENLPKGNERILFVDDEAPIVKIGTHMLTKLGYKVTTTTSSKKALDLFRSKPESFDLLISDLTMPGMGGDRLAIEFLKIQPDIPVILCTGYSKKISKDAAMEIGISAFAYKPIIRADLAKTVRKVLDNANPNTHK